MSVKLLVGLAIGLAASGAGRIAGQDTGVRGPLVGYVFDAGRSAIRPIRGIPAAATIGATIDLGLVIEQAAISAEHNAAVVIAQGSHAVLAVRGLPDHAIASLIEGLFAADAVVLSDDGTSAAARSGSRIAVVRGIPYQSHVAYQFDLAGGEGQVVAMAVSGAGDVLAVLAGDGRAGVWFLEQSRAPRAIARLNDVPAVAFSADGTGALIADRVRNELTWIPSLREPAGATLTWGRQDGIEAPIGVAAHDDRRVLVANAGGTLVGINLNGGRSALRDCECLPDRLQVLRRGSLFLLTALSDLPLTLFENNTAHSGILRVPPVPRDQQF
jgi:hypothetical protein